MQLTNYTFFNSQNHLYTNPIKGLRGYGLSYRFQFNGMEKDDEVGGEGNFNSTFYREYDARLGKWLSVDPKLDAWQSPYVSMANNPILYNDIFGDIIGKGKEHHTKLKSEVTALKTNSEKDESTLKRKLEKAKPGSSNERKLTEKLKNVEDITKVLQATIDELNEMDLDTKTTFNFIESDKSGGNTKRGSKDNEVDMTFGSEDYFGNMAHEAKHGHQFLKGKLSLTVNGAAGFLHDANDEAEGYARQFLVSPVGTTATDWYRRFGDNAVTAERAKLWNPTHTTMPLINLTSSSTILDIANANKNNRFSEDEKKLTYKQYQLGLGKEDSNREIYR
jgi:RHS repeat-associated protein